ncbi:hypothetical protein HELRODRAFT_168398 [Helobdella robusta]|uniref:Uncharacterized protein n=1 Tax=Helobdella robusta TaxID=6412 RepID=T1F0J7_HELRO|nr:hypothetical protein HELRODRAFT_168398 [Helobdella robusta]ESO09415.1 hypothetical protein HELRODRAFT_168398 [Helobdella robusta]
MFISMSVIFVVNGRKMISIAQRVSLTKLYRHDNNSQSMLLPYFDDDQMDYLCRIVRKNATLEEFCNGKYQSAFYWCCNEKGEYKNVRWCFAKEELIMDLKPCMKRYQRELLRLILNDSSMSSREKYRKLCKYDFTFFN